MPDSLMSLRAFAKLRGVSAMAVSDACKAGRLKESIVRDPESGRVSGIRDAALAMAEWDRNTDFTKAPPKEQARAAERRRVNEGGPTRGPEGVDGLEAAAESKYWDARLKESKYRTQMRELVPARDVEAQLRDVFTQCKVRLLAIPSRAKQELPHLSIDDVAKIDALIREACEDLAIEAAAPPVEPSAQDLAEIDEAAEVES